MNDEIRWQIEQIKREWDNTAKEHEKTSKAFDSLLKSVEHLRNDQIAGISVADAIARIRLELLKDKEPGSYYHTWQCNIAMCFYDKVNSVYRFNDLPMDTLLADNLHKMCNEAAENFLNVFLCKL